MKILNKKGFSLVEIVVVVAILIVFLAVLAPSLLRYTEDSRAQKDMSAADEITNAVKLALSDSNCFDEMYQYSIDNNFITYSDSSGIYGSQNTDEEYWAPDGSGKATTITFNPDENGVFLLDNAIVNDMTYGNGSIAPPRVIEGAKLKDVQSSFKGVSNGSSSSGLLYHQLSKTIGTNFELSSQTYKNSSYTVFIIWSRAAGMPTATVYGLFNGTNLDKNSPASMGTGTSTMPDDGSDPAPTGPAPLQRPNFDNSALGGGGTTPNPDRDYIPESQKGAATFSKSALGAFVTANNPKVIEFTSDASATGTDVSADGRGGVVAFMQGDTCYVASTIPGTNVRAPQNSSRLFDGGTYAGYKTVERLLANSLDTTQVTDFSYAFSNFGADASTVSLDIGYWDTGKVTTMASMFYRTGWNASSFGMNLSNWDVSKVRTFSGFIWTVGERATDWHIGDLGRWNVSSCTNFNRMFYWSGTRAKSWDIGNLCNWKMSQATNIEYMFAAAGQYSDEWHIGDVGGWDVSNVTKMDGVFTETGRKAVSWYVGDLGRWDISSTTSLYHMFWYASTNTAFNPGNIQSWDTSRITNMEAAFYGVAPALTIDLTGWNVDQVTRHESFTDSRKILVPNWIL